MFVIVALYKINDDLFNYIETWNNRKVSTNIGNGLPNQLLLLHQQHSAIFNIDIGDPEWYGIELAGNEDLIPDDVQPVVVDSIRCPLHPPIS